jgi:cupin 2 domain-containing protein
MPTRNVSEDAPKNRVYASGAGKGRATASRGTDLPAGREQAVNLFADLPKDLPAELFTTLLESAHVRIERIVSHGHASPAGFWYDQDQHEWIVVLQGAARLRDEDGTVEMRPGDFMNIPARRKHRVDWTTPDEPTIWLAVFYTT